MDILADLADEYAALDALVADLDAAGLDTLTPAEGFTVRDELSHLAFSEELASLAALDADAFRAKLDDLLADLLSAEGGPKLRAASMAPAELIGWWRTERQRTLDALRAHAVTDRIPWVVGDMSVTSFATARLMETWAHGQDVVDALGLDRAPTARLRHIAELGVRTRGFSYAVRGMAKPDADVRVALTGPDGDAWEWGAPDAADSVTGPALDFCLVVTQRRHVLDTALEVTGAAADEWMAIAQAFAGPPTDGRPAGSFPR
ncbi:MAG TPA: TIGR03084 family metal-binding protein [Acidimicrobiales bacterium]|nr:TIGR03084 family metal-binding protein [Acidimicrobiales bacterium]